MLKKLYMLLLLLLIFQLFISCSESEKSVTEPEEMIVFSKTFGGQDSDGASFVQQTFDNGYIIAGTTRSQGAGNADIWMIKTDKNGNEKWNKTFGGSEDDYVSSAQQTSDGGFIILGSTQSYGSGDFDFWLIKINESGAKIWDKTFGSDAFEYAESVQQTSDDGYIITGWNLGIGTIVIKTDENGTETWRKNFADHKAFSIKQITDNGYIITGETDDFHDDETTDLLLIKIDQNGNIVFNKTFGSNGYEVGSSVIVNSDDSFCIAGKTNSYGAGSADFWLVKFDINGNEVWNKTFGGSNYDRANAVNSTFDNGYIIVGNSRSYNTGDFDDILLIKTDSNGNEVWTKTYGSNNDRDRGTSIQQTSDGGFIVTGLTGGTDDGSDTDIWLLKTDENGNIN